MDLYILYECTYVFAFSSSSKAASGKRLGATAVGQKFAPLYRP